MMAGHSTEWTGLGRGHPLVRGTDASFDRQDIGQDVGKQIVLLKHVKAADVIPQV